jgi:hypothetical protein
MPRYMQHSPSRREAQISILRGLAFGPFAYLLALLVVWTACDAATWKGFFAERHIVGIKWRVLATSVLLIVLADLVWKRRPRRRAPLLRPQVRALAELEVMLLSCVCAGWLFLFALSC